MHPVYRNQLELRVFHLKRGGGHALIHWLASCAGRPVVHLNNSFSKPWKVRLRGERVFRRVLAGEAPEFRPTVYGMELPGGTTFRELARMPKDILLYNLENFQLDRVEREPLLNGAQERIVGSSRERRTVLILRDAFNTFASVRRGKRRMRQRLTRFYRPYWKSYAREFLGSSRRLPSDTIKISYNRWFEDVEYRRRLAAELGFPESQQGLDDVPGFGGGSSFSGTDFEGKARQMNVLGRWRTVRDDRRYLAAFDRETIELSNEIFGDITEGAIQPR